MAGHEGRGVVRVAQVLLAVAILACGASPAVSENALVWTEVQLALDGAGGATVAYQTRWRTSGSMHGFYFQGERSTPVFTGGTAELPGGRQVPLSITPAGDRWDVVLADGQAWGPGEATYTFSYRADLAAAGLVELTRGEAGEGLVVLNWAPVEWESPLDHHTLAVTFTSVPAPHEGDLSFEEAAATGLRTERFVNEKYVMSYRGVADPPRLWVRFHHERLAAGADHRVQLYLPATHFGPLVASAAERRAATAAAQERR